MLKPRLRAAAYNPKLNLQPEPGSMLQVQVPKNARFLDTEPAIGLSCFTNPNEGSRGSYVYYRARGLYHYDRVLGVIAV